MLWLAYSLLTALFESLKNLSSKKSLVEIDEYWVSFLFRLVIFLLLLPFLLFQGVPPLEEGFWGALIVSGAINSIATLLFMRAIKYSDLSLSIPLRNFTPLFLLFTSPLILGEFPSPLGLMGVLLIVGGSYILNLERGSYGLEPFRALGRERGPRLMLFIAFLWSISSNYDKIGVTASSPLLWVVAVNLFAAVSLLPLTLRRPLPEFSGRGFPLLLLAGILGGLGLFFQMNAITLALVAYVIAIKRLGVLLSVLWGRLAFKEENFRKRMPGAVLMVMGAVIIALS